MDLNSDEVFLSEKLHQTSRTLHEPHAAGAAVIWQHEEQRRSAAARVCGTETGGGMESFVGSKLPKSNAFCCFSNYFPTWLQAPPIGPLEPRLSHRGGSHRGHGCCLQARLQLAVSHELGQSHCGVRMCRELNHCSDS